MIPSTEVPALLELLMQSIVNRDFLATCEFYERLEVSNGIQGFEGRGHGRIELSAGMEELVVWVYENYREVWRGCFGGRHGWVWVYGWLGMGSGMEMVRMEGRWR